MTEADTTIKGKTKKIIVASIVAGIEDEFERYDNFNKWFMSKGEEVSAYVRVGKRTLVIKQRDAAPLQFSGPTLQLANVVCRVEKRGLFTELMTQLIVFAKKQNLMFMVENMNNPIVEHVAIDKFGMYMQSPSSIDINGEVIDSATGANAWMLQGPSHTLLMQLSRAAEHWETFQQNYRKWEEGADKFDVVRYYQNWEKAINNLERILGHVK